MNTYIENDKTYSPYLLAASFCGFIKFEGNFSKDRVLYWKFSPEVIAKQLINQFETKTEPHIPAKDLFEAIETFWKQVSELKDGG